MARVIGRFFILHLVIDRIKPNNWIYPVQKSLFQLCISGRTQFVMLQMVSADMRLPNCSSKISLISLVLLPIAYKPTIWSAWGPARSFSCLRITSRSKMLLRFRRVFMVIFPIDVCTCTHVAVTAIAEIVFVSFHMTVHFYLQGTFNWLSNNGASTSYLSDSENLSFGCSRAWVLNSAYSNDFMVFYYNSL